MTTATEIGEQVAAEWLQPAEPNVPDHLVAEQIAKAGAAHLDAQQPGWADQCDPALAWMDLANLCADRLGGRCVPELEGAWLDEIRSRRTDPGRG